MSLLINCSQDSIWKDRPNDYIAHIPLPGIAVPIVRQQGNVIHITGENRILGISYNYDLSLKPDATQTIEVQIVHGMVVITTSKVASINRDLSVYPPAAG